MGLHDRLIDFVGQRARRRLPFCRRVVCSEEAALAGDGLDHALALELRIGLGDGVAVDTEFLGQRTDGREGLTRLC